MLSTPAKKPYAAAWAPAVVLRTRAWLFGGHHAVLRHGLSGVEFTLDGAVAFRCRGLFPSSDAELSLPCDGRLLALRVEEEQKEGQEEQKEEDLLRVLAAATAECKEGAAEERVEEQEQEREQEKELRRALAGVPKHHPAMRPMRSPLRRPPFFLTPPAGEGPPSPAGFRQSGAVDISSLRLHT